MPPVELGRYFANPIRHELQLVAGLAFDRLLRIGSLFSELPEDDLTPREKEVLTWLGGGKSIWEIATITGTAEGTVRHHTKNAIARLKALNKTHAVVKAQKLGLIHIQ